MKSTLIVCVLSLIAASSAQFLINYQYNINDASCGSIPKAVFANRASTAFATCNINNNNFSSNSQECTPGTTVTVTTNQYNNANCTGGTVNRTSATQTTDCFQFNTGREIVTERIDCQNNFVYLENAIVFQFYTDAACGNLYGVYSYLPDTCQIAEGGYRFTRAANGFTFLNYTDTLCQNQNGIQAGTFTGDGQCRTLTPDQTGFAPTFYYRTSSTSSGSYAGTGGNSNSGNGISGTTNSGSTNSGAITAGSTTSSRGNSAASVAVNMVLVSVAAAMMLML